MQRTTRSVPIVFANIVDPVGAGYITSLARPGGNITGFTAFEYSIGGKWLELLKQMAPRVTRIAVLRDPAFPSGIGQFAAIESAASSAVELSVIDPRDAAELKRALDAFAQEPNGGLIVTASVSVSAHHELINSLALQHRLPAIHAFRYSILSGGLASYGPNTIDVYRRAATYVDRILKGAKPSELPVQAPTKYELVINLKAARILGLEIPPTLLATADEVIE
jgi:putative ABC transport system substrate-binding protein